MEYNSFRYIYPPRPKNPIPPSDLDFWDNNTLIGQPKLNGSNSVLFIGDRFRVMNRHNQPLTGFHLQSEVESLFAGKSGWFVINGEYMNKNKLDGQSRSFNHKLVIFDILVNESNHLVGSEVMDRSEILNGLFDHRECDLDYLTQISDNIYQVKSYDSNFSQLFEEFSKVDMLEGLVLKRKNAKLEMGIREDNNSKWMLKSRKPHKNYKF